MEEVLGRGSETLTLSVMRLTTLAFTPKFVFSGMVP